MPPQSRENESPAQCTERITTKKLSMETSLQENLFKCNPQEASPLFNTLPKEIRDIILQFATAQYEDLDRAYPENAFHYRPGYRGPHKTCTNLLLTCRRLWLEANAMPMRQSAMTFWFEPTRGPPKQLRLYEGKDWTQLNRQHFTTLQFFVQMHVLNVMFYSGSRGQDGGLLELLKPKVFRITIRHTDWNRWEDPLPLCLSTQWLQRALDGADMDTIQQIQVELETLEKYKDQFDPFVRMISQVCGKAKYTSRGDGKAVQLKATGEPRVWHWTGAVDVGGQIEEAHKGMKQLDYRVVVLTWKPVAATPPSTDPKAAEDEARRQVFRNMPTIRLRGSHRAPNMVDYQLRSQLLQGGWDRIQFPYADFALRKQAVMTSQNMEDEMRSRFLKMMAEVEIRKLREQWQAQSSLLKFED